MRYLSCIAAVAVVGLAGCGGNAADDFVKAARSSARTGTTEAFNVLKPPTSQRDGVESALTSQACQVLEGDSTVPGEVESAFLANTGQSRAEIEQRSGVPQGALNSWALGSAERIDDAVSAVNGDSEAAAEAFATLGCEALLGRAFHG